MISDQLEAKLSEGLYPYEGEWRSLEEINRLQSLMVKKDRIIFLDLAFLFLFITLVVLVLLFLLVLLV